MWNTIGATIIISWDDLFLEQAVQRKAVGLGLRIRIVVFTFLANRPAVLAGVALGPPAIEDTTIRLSIEGSFLTTRTACLVRPYGIFQPEIRARNQVASHVDIIVFHENDLAPKCIAARESIHLLDQCLAWFIGWMGLAGEDNLYRALGILTMRFRRSISRKINVARL